jgi:hypothetical protein
MRHSCPQPGCRIPFFTVQRHLCLIFLTILFLWIVRMPFQPGCGQACAQGASTSGIVTYGNCTEQELQTGNKYTYWVIFFTKVIRK